MPSRFICRHTLSAPQTCQFTCQTRPQDILDEFVIPPGSLATQRWIALLGRVAPVTRWNNLQDLADRLDPIHIPILVDVTLSVPDGTGYPPKRTSKNVNRANHHSFPSVLRKCVTIRAHPALNSRIRNPCNRKGTQMRNESYYQNHVNVLFHMTLKG